MSTTCTNIYCHYSISSRSAVMKEKKKQKRLFVPGKFPIKKSNEELKILAEPIKILWLTLDILSTF